MTREYIEDRSCTPNRDGTIVTSMPSTAYTALGRPERVAWFLDRETGLVYCVAPDDVGID